MRIGEQEFSFNPYNSENLDKSKNVRIDSSYSIKNEELILFFSAKQSQNQSDVFYECIIQASANYGIYLPKQPRVKVVKGDIKEWVRQVH